MSRPLRFCMLTTFYPPYSFGGDGVYVHALSRITVGITWKSSIAGMRTGPGSWQPAGVYQDHQHCGA
jgi:hypothetical protein